jgi:hypothetical protein
MNIRVEYDPTPIRHIAVQCPDCKKWFYGWDIIDGEFDDLRWSYQICIATFKCPICGAEFGGIHNKNKVHIEEVSYPEVYEGCLTRKEIWT